MNLIKLLVVDDAKNAREGLARMLAKHAAFQVVDCAANAQEALDILKRKQIDAIFLDVEMPGITGLEMAGILSAWPKPPHVVFATSYNQYALAAFEANAIDYILKPYQENRIIKALEKIKRAIASGKAENTALQGLEKSLFEKGLVKKMTVRKKKSKDRIVMDPADFDYFHAQRSEIFAHAAGQDYVINMTLRELTASMATYGFELCHKSYLVNLTKIEKIAPLFHSAYEITLKGGSKVPLSRGYAKIIRDKIGYL